MRVLLPEASRRAMAALQPTRRGCQPALPPARREGGPRVGVVGGSRRHNGRGERSHARKVRANIEPSPSAKPPSALSPLAVQPSVTPGYAVMGFATSLGTLVRSI